MANEARSQMVYQIKNCGQQAVHEIVDAFIGSDTNVDILNYLNL